MMLIFSQSFKVCSPLPYHPNAFTPTQLLITLPLWQVVVRLPTGLPPLSVLLFLPPLLHLDLFGQLVFKIFQVAIGSLVCWV